MTTADDTWYGTYKTVQAHNYEKREETFIINTPKEVALKNAHQLIECEAMDKLKTEQKEAKVKRQRKRKKAEKPNNDSEERKTSVISLYGNETIDQNDTETVGENQNEGFEVLDHQEQIDDEFLDLNAAFVKVSVKQNKNITSNKASVSKIEKPTSTPMAKFIKPKITKSQSDRAEMLGMQSCYLALNDNEFDKAIDLLSQAIFLTPEDVRHFLNRSYCYLRLGQYSLALNDAQSAKNKSQIPEHFVKAMGREGQALRGLQKYHEAEGCFQKLLKLEKNKWIFTELILARASQLTNMGFSMMDALSALQQCSAVIDAVTLLTSENPISNPELEININDLEIESCDGEEIYSSDDESSSSILLSNLVSALADESCYLEDLQPQPSSSRTQQYLNASKITIKDSASVESLPHSDGSKSNSGEQWAIMSNKSVPTGSKTQVQKPVIIDSSSIWVGSIDKSVTEHKLRELFGVFGKINNIRRFSHDRNYAFIDFNSKKAAKKALNNTKSIEINGIKLLIKPAVGFSGKK